MTTFFFFFRFDRLSGIDRISYNIAVTWFYNFRFDNCRCALPPSFPLASASTFALATILYAEEMDSEHLAILAFCLALFATFLVVVVFGKTIFRVIHESGKAVDQRKIFGTDPVLCVELKGSAAKDGAVATWIKSWSSPSSVMPN